MCKVKHDHMCFISFISHKARESRFFIIKKVFLHDFVVFLFSVLNSRDFDFFSDLIGIQGLLICDIQYSPRIKENRLDHEMRDIREWLQPWRGGRGFVIYCPFLTLLVYWCVRCWKRCER